MTSALLSVHFELLAADTLLVRKFSFVKCSVVEFKYNLFLADSFELVRDIDSLISLSKLGSGEFISANNSLTAYKIFCNNIKQREIVRVPVKYK
uniref:Uncharacterized protein n=1 Tax=Romanomermis culicivorax TaxID=13658 RepID=A0A915HT13_ROMCU